MPFFAQHVDAEKQRLAEQQLEKELRAEKLATVDSILWRTSFLEQDSTAQGNTGKLHTYSQVSPAPSGCSSSCLNWPLEQYVHAGHQNFSGVCVSHVAKLFSGAQLLQDASPTKRWHVSATVRSCCVLSAWW